MTENTVLVHKVEIEKKTDKAYLIKTLETTLWIPKSVVVNYNKTTKNLQIQKWFAETKKELEPHIY